MSRNEKIKCVQLIFIQTKFLRTKDKNKIKKKKSNS